jgi:hypothetical protein
MSQWALCLVIQAQRPFANSHASDVFHSYLTNEPWENKKAQPGKRPNCAFKMFSTKEISGSNHLIGGSTLFGPHRPDTPRHLRSGQVCTERKYGVSFGKNAETVFVEPADAMPLAQIMYDLPWFGEA